MLLFGALNVWSTVCLSVSARATQNVKMGQSAVTDGGTIQNVIVLLLTAKFDFGKTRADLFRDNPRFTAKIALVDRIQWFPGDSSGTEDHAWYVWGPAPGIGIGRARLIYEGREAA